MSKSKTKSFQEQAAEQIRDEAMGIAQSVQRPGQTKKQTKLIAQGITKGIELYKKRHKEKVRDWDRERKKLSRQIAETGKLKTEPGIPAESSKRMNSSAALLFGGAGYGLLAVFLFLALAWGKEIKIANEAVSDWFLLISGLIMLCLSIWMFWVRR